MGEQLLSTLVGLSGLFGGVTVAFLAFLINRRIGKKKRLFDEQYIMVNSRAKAASWNITLVVLILAWAIAIIYEGISFSFFLISGIYVLHCFSLIFTNKYYSNNS